MLIYFALFASVMGLYRKRGWLSPLLGGCAVGLEMFFELILSVLTYGAATIPMGALVTITLYSCLCSFVTFAVCSRLVPTVDYKRVPKASRFPYRALGFLLIVLLCAFFVLSIAGMSEAGGGQQIQGLAGVTIIGIIAIVACFRIARQQRAAGNRWKLLTGNQHPILYLRSFAFDKDSSQGSASFTLSRTASIGSKFDEVLARAVEKLGVYIALGNPEDYLPTPGACKIYPTDEKWQEYVARLTTVSRAVFVVEGDTSGLLWELSHVRQTVSPDKLFVLTAPKQYRKLYRRKKKAPLWDAFRTILMDSGFADPGGDPGFGAVISFGKDFAPVPLARGLRTPKGYRAIFERFLPKVVGDFDFRTISDILFTGIVEDENAPAVLGWPRRLSIAAAALVCVAGFTAIGRTALPLVFPAETPNDATDPSKPIIYQGSPLAYTLSLPATWAQLPPQGEFNVMFQANETTAFGVIAEAAEVLPPGMTAVDYANAIVQMVNQNSETPLRVLAREQRSIDGYEWEFVRYEWQTGGIPFTTSAAFCVRYDGAYQLNGWTSTPETNNATIDSAMYEFKFPGSPRF